MGGGFRQAPGEHSELGAWVRQHRVSWEVTPHFEVEGHAKRLVARDLCLSAAPSPRCDGSPGCAECARVHEGLCRLALSVLPAGSHFQMGPFDGSFRMRPENRWRPEILLTVELRARHTSLAPMEGATLRMVSAMEQRLRALGAQHGVWLEPRRAA